MAIPAYLAASEDGSLALTQEEVSGRIHIWDVNSLFEPGPVAVEPRGKQVIIFGDLKRNALLQNYPNPFNPETWIPFRLQMESTVTIRIYDNAGALVRLLPLGTKQAGDYLSRGKAAYWDGRNEMSEPVASGVYWYALDAGDFSATRKMLIQK